MKNLKIRSNSVICKNLISIVLLCEIAGCMPATQASNPTLAQVKQAASARWPQWKIVDVEKTPLPGVYELILSGNQLFYTDAKAEYLFQGELIDVKNRRSLSSERLKGLRKNDFATLPLQLAIKEVIGNGKRRLVVFSDPDCPFCKKLEATLREMSNLTIYTFLLPLEQLHPDSSRKATLLWCASDRTKAWRSWMDKNKLPAGNSSCETPLGEIASISQRLGISGTPAILFENGHLLAGAYPKEAIEAALSAAP